ncbi:hypothetical protein [Paraburkholderia sp. BCC1886]|uniref:hypothetical protein n=1 Tax=Paraburkholderia sp. BCC1886 TaxID=2562670 RepID=UPI0011828DD3|nr:hypothetical protein [Paraburkholderia sp. BCC1886]
MVRQTHSKKEIEAALVYAESKGWRIRSGGKGHAWGKLYCPVNSAECRCGEFCISSVWSTPKNAGNHAKHLRRIVDNCTALVVQCAEGVGTQLN